MFYLWQIPINEGPTYGDSSIIIPDQGKARLSEEAPRGVIVSAGLQALDVLRSNGCDIGYIVMFVRLSPWRVPIATIAGKEQYLIPLKVGDLISVEDTAAALRTGKPIVVREGKHVIDESLIRTEPKFGGQL